ncbi:YIP1 family protein [Bernardetia sp. MNP-M8]|uniref:YIP1 family protein n=1 Tax=Bernardetia sp. MNP-M8 TaxID=3127470 RepID=UPI0030CBB5B7
MERILDRQNNPQAKNSWKPVLITNGISVFLLLLWSYYMFFIEMEDATFPVENIIVSTFSIVSIFTAGINILCILVSLFISKTYWKKWLIMVAYCLILFICALIIQFILDFDKIIN